MSGNMQRWSSGNFLDDSSSQISAHSDISAVDDRYRSPDIGQRLRTLFKDQLFTDVKFVLNCGVKPKPVLWAHKAILAIGSPKFKDMLYDQSSACVSTDEIQVNHISYESFKNVVEFLYTDDVIFGNDQSVIETLTAAQKFQIQPLINKCESYIDSVELTEDNACSKFQLASDHKLAALKRRCAEFIQENTLPVLRSTDFLASSTSVVRTVCKMERFNLRSEIELLNAVFRWADGRPEAKLNKRSVVEPFLKHIRLLTVTTVEFNQFVQKNPKFFTAPEAANILMTIANPSNRAPNLPSWCNKGQNRCTFSPFSPRARERDESINQFHKMFILLKPTLCREYLPSLNCILELVCFRGNHLVEGLKLDFDDPVDKLSTIGHLSIKVNVTPSNFNFEEHIQIKNSKDVEVSFSRPIMARKGDKVLIRAEASDVENYRFLQFDENSSKFNDSPFTCTLASVPRQNKLFFISEVIYRRRPPGSRRTTNNYNRRGNPPRD